MLGTPALFATAYGNVGSSIYYALGLTAVYALGLTPLVFLIAGIVFAMTAATYAEGTVLYPEAGGSSSFARHGFNEIISFGAAWAQMLVYVVTVATSAFFVPHYLSIFWEPLKTNPWDIVGGAIVIVVLVTLNVVGVQEAARLSIVLAVIDFATQVLLVLLGFFLVFSPTILVDNIHWGVAPTWSNFAIAIPVAMLAYTGVETVSNLAEEAREPARSVPERLQARRGRGLHDLPDAAARRALGDAGRGDQRAADDAISRSRRSRAATRTTRSSASSRTSASRAGSCACSRSTSACSRPRSSSSPRTRASSAPRGSRTRWRATARSPRSSGGCTRRSRRRCSRSSSSPGSRRS